MHTHTKLTLRTQTIYRTKSLPLNTPEAWGDPPVAEILHYLDFSPEAPLPGA